MACLLAIGANRKKFQEKMLNYISASCWPPNFLKHMSIILQAVWSQKWGYFLPLLEKKCDFFFMLIFSIISVVYFNVYFSWLVLADLVHFV